MLILIDINIDEKIKSNISSQFHDSTFSVQEMAIPSK